MSFSSQRSSVVDEEKQSSDQRRVQFSALMKITASINKKFICTTQYFPHVGK